VLHLRPYAVKEYAKRWYLIAYCIERQGIRVYGLDRITKMESSDKKFRMPKNFDVDELFSTSFGIYVPEGKARTITFRTSESEARFLRDLPLHRSQEEIKREDEMVTFSIFVCPDRNLIMEFCKYGSRIEVLSPADIREDVAEELRKAAEKYR
jgi:predicted DNA-binding transcriptional regulator YafY